MSGITTSVRACLLEFLLEDEDELLGRLWDTDVSGTEERPAPPGRGCFLAYFPADVDVAPLAAWLSTRQGSLTDTEVPDVDWVARFRETFRGFEHAGFRVAPVWDRPDVGVDTIIVDPGRAFGTGTHETTRLCLAAIRRLAAGGPLGRVLDLGAGTGILALAALQCGARFALASDFDPEATASTRLHATLNKLSLEIVLGDGGRFLRPGRFDLVLANIAAPLLLERKDEVATLPAPGGTLVLSGLLASDVSEVEARYASCGTPEVLRDGEWAALVFGPCRG